MGEKQLRAIDRWNLALAGIFVAICAIAFPRDVLLGMAVGAALSCLNFWAMHTLLQRSLRVDGPRRAAMQLLLVGKMGILIALIFLAMRFLPLHPAALAVGLSIFLISIAIESLRFALGTKAPDGRA